MKHSEERKCWKEHFRYCYENNSHMQRVEIEANFININVRVKN